MLKLIRDLAEDIYSVSFVSAFIFELINDGPRWWFEIPLISVSRSGWAAAVAYHKEMLHISFTGLSACACV